MKTQTFLLLFLTTITFAQSDYSYPTNCPVPSDAKSQKNFALAMDCVRMNKYLGAANKIFMELTEVDKTFCDGFFYAGYTYRAYNMNNEAVAAYYIADSLSPKPNLEYKQSLAVACMISGRAKLARKKYTEITKYFPDSPEGYYGIALSSTEIGDVAFGLENIVIAEAKYNKENKDVQFLTAILLNLNGRYEESLNYFEMVKSKFSKDDHFNGTYAQSLYEVATLNKDEKMMKAARKHYDKVKDKTQLTEYLRSKFE